MTAPDRKTSLTARFLEIYNRPPTLWSRAPGRVDLMGSHTDYNLGYVLTMTIDRDTWIAAAERNDRTVQIHSLNMNSGGIFHLEAIERRPDGDWTNYVRAVAAILQDEGFRLEGWDGLIHSTIPLSSGLSSSAALEMATSVLFQQASGFRLDPVRMALLGQKAENEYVGVNSGILDQYSSAMGRQGSALLLDCRDLTSRIAPIADGVQVVICDTRAKRSLVGSEYGERRAQCEEGVRILQQFLPAVQSLRDVSLADFNRFQAALPEVVAKRCRFIIEENQRVLDLAETISIGNRERLRALYTASYAGARDLYEISAPSMQAMVDASLRAPGLIGIRQAGAGFGGALVALVEKDQVEVFIQHLSTAYQSRTGIEPSIYAVQASDGAGPV